MAIYFMLSFVSAAYCTVCIILYTAVSVNHTGNEIFSHTSINHPTFIILFVSSLEEDPLYIAYADMMAKVFRSFNYFYRCMLFSTKLQL